MSNQGLPGNGTFDPSLFNVNASGSSTGLTPAIAATLSNTQASNLSLNPAQVQSLTDFHRQQQQQRPVQPVQPVQARPPQSNPFPNVPLPEHVLQHLRTLPPASKDSFLRGWVTTAEGQQYNRAMTQSKNQHRLAQAQAQAQVEAAKQRPIASASASPAPANLSLPAGTSAQGTASSSTATPERRGSNPVPITQAFTPSNLSIPTQPIQPRPQPPQAQTQAQAQAQAQAQPPNPQLHPSLTRPASGIFNSTPGSTQWQASNLPYRPSASTDLRYQHTPVPARRREDGMRGTMRSELARLMYASGDVENPDTDTIDYMEDLVVDWLAELCAPPPPIRTSASAPYTTPRLDYEIIRHRLARPSMRKYLDRFEYMEYKAVDMRSARRVVRGNYEPVDQKDLDGQLEKGFLDGENDVVQGKKKKKVKRGGGGVPDVGTGEKKKPGPKKGWKRGSARGQSGSVKPEEV